MNSAITVCLKKVKIKVTAHDSCVASTVWMRRKNITSTCITDMHLISHLLFIYHPGIGDFKCTVLQNWWPSFNSKAVVLALRKYNNQLDHACVPLQ